MQTSIKVRVYDLEQSRKRHDQIITNQHLAVISLSANLEVINDILKETVPDLEERIADRAKEKIESIMEKKTDVVVEEADPKIPEEVVIDEG